MTPSIAPPTVDVPEVDVPEGDGSAVDGPIADGAATAAYAELTRRRADELQQAVDALRLSAGELARVWTGPGESAFLATRIEWERAVSQMQVSLAGMNVLLDRVATQ
jgi:uncharacterized protein YukE